VETGAEVGAGTGGAEVVGAAEVGPVEVGPVEVGPAAAGPAGVGPAGAVDTSPPENEHPATVSATAAVSSAPLLPLCTPPPYEDGARPPGGAR